MTEGLLTIADIVEEVEALEGEQFVLVNTEMSQTISVSGMNSYGDAKCVFDSPSEVGEAWEELGFHELREEEREHLSILAISDSVSL